MNMVLNCDPFPHVLIQETHTASECEQIESELRMLSRVLKPPSETGSGKMTVDGQEVLKKNNRGIFLPDVYRDFGASWLVSTSRKFFDAEFMEKLKQFNFVFGYLPRTTYDNILVQFYAEGQYYKKHADQSVFSIITNMSSEPREYGGGLLVFEDYGYSVDLQRNQTILFPGFVEHEVTPVSLQSTDLMKSRITITTFVGTK